MADRYWVGGTAAWDGTAGTKWATTSGGAGGASVPTSADAVFFTAASTGTCTISTGNTGAQSINCTGHTGTIAGSAAISVAGSVTLVAGQTFTYGGTITLTATGTLTTGGKNLSSVVIDAPGGTVTLGSALTISGSNDLTVTAGTITTSASNFAITASSLIAIGSGTKTIALNGSTVTLTATTVALDTTSATNLTVTAGTSTITVSNGGFFYGQGYAFANVNFTSTGTLTTFARFDSCNTLTLTGPSASGVTTYGLLSCTIATLAFTGTTAVRRILVNSQTGSQITLTVTTVTGLTDIDFQNIAFNTSRSGTRLGNRGNNTNITFPAAKTVYWNLAGPQSWFATAWATSSGGTPAVNNFPLAQDTAVFDNTGSVTGAITASGGYAVNTVDMSTRTTAMTLNISNIYVYGNWTNGSGTTLGGGGNLTFQAFSGTQTLTSAGKSFTANIFTGSNGATFSLADALTTSVNFTCNRGLTLNNNTLTAGNFLNSGTALRTLAFGTGNITVTGTGTSAVDISVVNLLITGTPVINLTYSGASAMTVTTAGLSEANSISFNVSAGTYALTFSTSGTARNLNFTGFSGSLLTASGLLMYGDLTLSSGMTFSTGSGLFLAATSGTKTITSNGKTITQTVYVYGAGGAFQLQDALSITGSGSLVFVNGTLNLNGQTATVTTVSTQAGTKNLTFDGGTLVVTSSGSGAFNNNVPTGFTTTAGTGTGTIRMSSASAKTFVGGGSTYNCTLDQGGAGALTITGANTFSNITASQTATSACSILFTASTTTTFTNWNASGQSGRLLTITSATAAGHTLSKASGIVSANFLSVSRSTATGGATWYAGANSTNGGLNSGWIFSNAPASGNFFMFF